MNLFESVKAAVTMRRAAEHYGLKVSRSNMVCCPFHLLRLRGHRRCDRPCGKALWFEQLRGGTKAGTGFWD